MRTLGPFELSDWAQTNMPEESLKVMRSMLRTTSFFPGLCCAHRQA